jgi:hypothetical protein
MVMRVFQSANAEGCSPPHGKSKFVVFMPHSYLLHRKSSFAIMLHATSRFTHHCPNTKQFDSTVSSQSENKAV